MTHHKEISQIIQSHFGVEPESFSRLGNGICNEVYAVRADGHEVVVRMHKEPRYLFGSHKHIPLFRSKGIPVPEILAEDYSKAELPVAWQIQTRLAGRDIVDVIHALDDEQLKRIAAEIANVFCQLRDVPNDGRFGIRWGDDDDLTDSWTADIARMTNVVIGWGTRTGLLDDEFEGILRRLNSEYKGYFESVKPVTYYGDICAKNVMVHEGRFSGLVDLDAIAQGDPLEAVGRIKASWYGTHHGAVYTEAVMNELALNAEERQLVTMYALLNRTYWTFENGIQFNQNTTSVVDEQKARTDKAVVRALYKELTAF